jgi:3-oxoadipate enol-lactonase
MPQVQINGTTIHYIDQGRGRPLVLLHGFPLNCTIWDAQIAELSKRWRVIAPDLRGFGQSRSNDSFTMDSHAADMHALVQQLGAEPCVLAGLSMGGYVALAYARKCPAQLDGLVLIDTRAAGDTADARQKRTELAEKVKSAGPGAVVEEMMPRMLSPQTQREQPQVVQRLQQMIESCPPQTLINALYALRDREDHSDFLPSITDPTLIIVGEHDALTPPDLARGMHSAIAHAELVVVPDAGHMSPIENPQAVTQALDKFMSSLGSSA